MTSPCVCICEVSSSPGIASHFTLQMRLPPEPTNSPRISLYMFLLPSHPWFLPPFPNHTAPDQIFPRTFHFSITTLQFSQWGSPSVRLEPRRGWTPFCRPVSSSRQFSRQFRPEDVGPVVPHYTSDHFNVSDFSFSLHVIECAGTLIFFVKPFSIPAYSICCYPPFFEYS
ncbi:hypothetical protein L873DRAFT_1073015 [Choiromyces venosus 120613-1]|uniref:Uncharacterized protein n=1 Tax=Choiromyces venosus 120613-1 TaxID=1336337 RepID=A0A3N4K390_9PEZI|nr:hypothetical protein L873DRAFT_1073015 [Choiromyces venosus 120613-1]